MLFRSFAGELLLAHIELNGFHPSDIHTHPIPTLVQRLAQKSCAFYPRLVFRANDIPQRPGPRTPSSPKHGGESNPPSLCSLGAPPHSSHWSQLATHFLWAALRAHHLPTALLPLRSPFTDGFVAPATGRITSRQPAAFHPRGSVAEPPCPR